MSTRYNGDVRVGPWMYELVHTNRFRGDVRGERQRQKKEREGRRKEERKKETEKSFSFSEGKKENGGERFALHSRPSLWGEKRLLLRNVISMSSHNGADNGAV